MKITILCNNCGVSLECSVDGPHHKSGLCPKCWVEIILAWSMQKPDMPKEYLETL